MSIEDKIFKFITDMNYLNNEHVLGILFYGSKYEWKWNRTGEEYAWKNKDFLLFWDQAQFT